MLPGFNKPPPRRNARDSNLFIFESQYNNSFKQWEIDGRLDSEQAGIKKAQQWLKKYGLDQALHDYIKRRTMEIPETG